MARMTKRWTPHLNPPKNETPKPLEELLAHYGSSPTSAQRQRIRKAAGRALGRAMDLRGAAKGSMMRRLAALPLDGILTDEQLAVIRDSKWAKKPAVTKGHTE